MPVTAGDPRSRRISLVVAVADNGVIGSDGELPWHLPDDLRHFKRLTTGHPVIMGRRTFESIGRPLPGRRNMVLSRDPAYRAEGIEVLDSLEAALEATANASEVFVIGGGDVFRDALPRADRVHLTRVHSEVEGDVTFPPLDPGTWNRTSSRRHPRDEEHPVPFTFETWERRG